MYYIYNKKKCSMVDSVEIIEDIKEEYKTENFFISDKIYAYPIKHNDEIREATKEELFEKGLYDLQPGEKLFKGNIVNIKENKNFIKNKWNGSCWVEGATVQEQLEYYKQKIIECTKEIYIEERAGFKPSDELLQKKEHYSNLHMQISQPVALKINQHMDSTKPGTAQM